MTEPSRAVLSVRGEAQSTVAPDFVVFGCLLSVVRSTKLDALQSAAATIRGLTDELRTLGGVPLTVESERHPLTWSVQSATTYDEHEKYGPTGNIVANVPVSIIGRDFDQLADLGAVLAGHEKLTVQNTSWQVDPDNPAWPRVRAAAIDAAIKKGRDYATALGGRLESVEHVADVGLLGGDGSPHLARRDSLHVGAASWGAGFDGAVPPLDPVPQELVATIDARFVAQVAALQP